MPGLRAPRTIPCVQRYKSPSTRYAPLLDGDNYTVISDPAIRIMNNDNNNNDWEDVNDDDDDDNGKENLSRDYNDILPVGFNEEQLRLDLEYTKRDFDNEPETVAFDEDFIDEDIYNEFYITEPIEVRNARYTTWGRWQTSASDTIIALIVENLETLCGKSNAVTRYKGSQYSSTIIVAVVVAVVIYIS
ncbi:hypothetical protein NEUTE2DRAFT_141621 [Neurospora tetrasperma FGSC 2509]|nr:hypothetical protein NEUTE2DRAFT_141621 [Neurospora tetrasperma FGSC 2509]